MTHHRMRTRRQRQQRLVRGYGAALARRIRRLAEDIRRLTGIEVDTLLHGDPDAPKPQGTLYAVNANNWRVYP